MSPLITLKEHEQLHQARSAQETRLECSLDLQRSTTVVEIMDDHWRWNGRAFPYLNKCKARTVYYWDGSNFLPAARYSDALIKLVPTDWGPPTFEIDGIKMLCTETISPHEDARRKVLLVEPRGKRILDTCGGLGYFAAWCLREGAEYVHSFEKSASVMWLRSLNPWSPRAEGPLRLTQGDITQEIHSLADTCFDAVLHDPPRFGIAGELYSQDFYVALSRVLQPHGVLFHYTGTPNKLTSGRDVPREVSNRLGSAGFSTRMHGDGVLARKLGRRAR